MKYKGFLLQERIKIGIYFPSFLLNLHGAAADMRKLTIWFIFLKMVIIFIQTSKQILAFSFMFLCMSLDWILKEASIFFLEIVYFTDNVTHNRRSFYVEFD